MRRADTAFVSAIPAVVAAYIKGDVRLTVFQINLNTFLYKLYLSHILYR